MKYPAKRLAFVIVDIGGGSNITPENALKEIVGPSTNTDPPLRNYYAEASYGTEELDGQVFGPFPYDIGTCANSNTSGMANGLRPMVDLMGGGTFNHYLWYIGSKTRNLCLERPRRGGHARPALQRHLVQRLIELCGHGPGARAQLRHAAFIVDGLRLGVVRRQSQ